MLNLNIMNFIEINELNTPYTLDFSKIGGLGNVTSDAIFITSTRSIAGTNRLILGELSKVEGLPSIKVVVEDHSLDLYTSASDAATSAGGLITGFVANFTAGEGVAISNFVSPANSYWFVK